MSFVIDFNHHHSQTLLDLVNAFNAETVYAPLTTERIRVESYGPPEPDGRVSALLTNKSKPDDYVVVRYRKLSLNDILTLKPEHLTWFDLSKGKPADLRVWSEAAMASFESACAERGIIVSKAWENPAQCHVEYDILTDRYILVYECESFVYESRTRITLPYHIGQDLTKTTLPGLEYDLAGFWGRKLLEEVTITKLNGFRYRVFV